MNHGDGGTTKRTLFKSSLVYITGILLVVSILYSWFMYKMEVDRVHKSIEDRNLLLNTIIDHYFSELERTILVLVQEEGVANAPFMAREDHQKILDIYEHFKGVNKNIRYIYSGYEDGLLLISNYDLPEGFDPKLRPWYESAVAASPDISIGLPYQDITDSEWLISTSMVIPGTDSDIRGVMAIDTSIRDISDALRANSSEFETSYSVLTDSQGKMIIHHDEGLINQHVDDMIRTDGVLVGESGNFSYMYMGISKIAHYSRIQDNGWYIITVVDESAIVMPVLRRILINLMFFTVLSINIAVIGSNMIRRKYTHPMMLLKKRIGDYVEGKESEEDLYEYPENEMGSMAAEVEALTREGMSRRDLVVEEAKQLAAKSKAELSIYIATDPLTHLNNRTTMENALVQQVEIARQSHQSLCIIFIDIDGMKGINRNYGRVKGDQVLKGVADIIDRNIRENDVCGRWGDDVFLLIVSDCHLTNGQMMANTIMRVVEVSTFNIDGQVTLSAGCCEYTGIESIDDLIRMADMNLIRAKDSGGNTVK